MSRFTFDRVPRCNLATVPRSYAKVVIATRQPSLTGPRVASTGTRTSVKKMSLKSFSPVIVSSGRTSTPGSVMSTSRHVMPLCLGTLVSVRTSSSHQFARLPSVFHVLWPLTTQESPSSTAEHRSDARSEPAFGSEKPWHQMSSPRSMRGRSVGLLLVGPVLDDRRCDVRQAHDVERARRVGAVHFLGVDDLFHHAGAAAAPFLGPGDGGEASVGECAVPGAKAFEALAADVHRAGARAGAGEIGGEVGVEPRAEFRAELLGFSRIPKVHDQRSTSRYRRSRAVRRAHVVWRRSLRAAPRSCARDRRPSTRP